MNNDGSYQRFAALVDKNTSFSICLPANPTVDSVAAGVGLYVVLNKLGKNASVACANFAPSSFANIIGADKVQNKIASGGNNLTISFPYTEGSIDKVTYNIEGNFFNLLIQPREGFQKIEPSQVKYAYSGAKVDVMIILDAPTLNTLGELYTGNQEYFKGHDIVNIDRHLTNANFGTLNIVEKKSSSTSEIVLKLVAQLNTQIDRDTATNLYSGIVAATNNFTAYSVTPDTFEATAYLLKLGAVKKASPAQPINQPAPLRRPLIPQQSPFTAPFDDFGDYDDSSYYPPQPIAPKINPIPQQRTPLHPQFNQPTTPQKAQPAQQVRQVRESAVMPEEIVENKEDIFASEQDSQQKPAPKEWLKPKIFRGSNLV